MGIFDYQAPWINAKIGSYSEISRDVQARSYDTQGIVKETPLLDQNRRGFSRVTMPLMNFTEKLGDYSEGLIGRLYHEAVKPVRGGNYEDSNKGAQALGQMTPHATGVSSFYMGALGLK